MEGINLAVIMEIISKFGTLGVLIVVWWSDRKQLREQHDKNEKEMAAVLVRYGQDMTDMRRMYENNVNLVRDYEKQGIRMERVLSELMGVVALNTQTFTKLDHSIEHNLFCPIVRRETGGEERRSQGSLIERP